MKNHHPTSIENQEASLTQLADRRAPFHPLGLFGNRGMVRRRSVACHFPAPMLDALNARFNLAGAWAFAEVAVRTISPLKCRRFTPILEGGTVSGDRKWPEGIPGGRL